MRYDAFIARLAEKFLLPIQNLNQQENEKVAYPKDTNLFTMTPFSLKPTTHARNSKQSELDERMKIDQADFQMLFRVILACFLGGLIGWERERHRNIVSAGIRTYGAISLGACAFGLLSYVVTNADPSRIAAQVVTGIGFLGGGIIFRQGDYVTGLTTAATLWATAAVGLAVAFGLYFVAILIAILIFLLLYLPRLGWWKKISTKAHVTHKP